MALCEQGPAPAPWASGIKVLAVRVCTSNFANFKMVNNERFGLKIGLSKFLQRRVRKWKLDE